MKLDRKRKIRQTIFVMKGILSKVLVFSFFLLSIFYFLASAAPSFAEASADKPASAVSQTDLIKTNTATSSSLNSDVPNNLHNWTQTVMIEVMSSLSCQLTGIDPTTPNRQCLGVDQKTGKIGFLPAGNLEKGQVGGAIGGMTSMITMLYTPPLHTSDYFQNLAQNFGISKKTYAAAGAGRGYGELTPLMNTWKIFRDIVYSLLVIVMIVIGLGIMLRLKIDPRTVMSIQNQIPKIIVGIFLVTFSFAIAGFLVDLMWVSTYSITNTLSQGGSDAGVLLNGKTPFAVIESYGGLDDITFPPTKSGKELFQNMLGIKTDWPQYIPFIQLTGLANPLDLFIHPEKFVSTITDMFSNPAQLFKFYFGPPFLLDGKPFNFVIDLVSLVGSALTTMKVMGWDSPSGGAEAASFGFNVDLGWIVNVLPAAVIASAVYSAIEVLLREVLPSIIIWLIITIALVVALFRLWFTLIMTYVMILVDVVLAPFWIIAGIIPGSSINFSAWLRDIAANLLAFPTVIFMFLLGKTFMDGFGSNGGGFMPPLIGGTADAELFGPLIAIGIILITPNVVNMLKAALKAPKMDTGVGKAFGVGPAMAINTGKGMGSTFMGADEVVMRETGPGKYEWGKRGTPRAIFGRIFGR